MISRENQKILKQLTEKIEREINDGSELFSNKDLKALYAVNRMCERHDKEYPTDPIVYPENLVCAILGERIPSDEICERELSIDQKHGLEKALSELSEREQKVLSLRFRESLTLDEAGVELGVTRERIRQIEGKALRRLRHPNRKKWWLNGYSVECERIYKEQLAIREQSLREIEQRLNEFARHRVAYMLDAVEKTMEGTSSETELCNELSQMTIKDLELSVRAYNCLRRAAINTVEELCELDTKRLCSIRNLGHKSAQEIIDRLNELGIQNSFPKRI